MKTTNNAKLPLFFRVVSTFIFALLFLTSVTISYAGEENLLTNILNQINSFFFGSSQVTSAATSNSSEPAPVDTTTSNGNDPAPDPPPPGN